MKLIQALLLSAAIATPVLSFAHPAHAPAHRPVHADMVQVDITASTPAGPDQDEGADAQTPEARALILDRDPLAAKTEVIRVIRALIVGETSGPAASRAA